VGLVRVGTVVVIVPFLMSFAFDVVSLLALDFNPAVCISVVYNVAQIFVVPISAALLRGSDAAGGVPAQTLAVVKVMITPISVIKSWVNHCSRV
jgi:hypothetical protein